jgi:hypothetical protein
MNDLIIETNNYKTVFSVCEEAMKNSRMIGIIGYPGAGKTTALESFIASNEQSYYVRVEPSMNAKQFYQAILKTLGIQRVNTNNSLYDLMNIIAYHLNYNQNKKILIIDEAGKFKSKFLEYVHELRDKTEKTTGIILAGPEYFYENLEKWKNKNVIGVPELFRRISHWETLSPPTLYEAKAICNAQGVMDDQVIKEIYKTSENFAEINYKGINYLISKKKDE